MNADPILSSLVSTEAVRLREYDLKNNTVFFETYYLFLLHERNLVRTARVLNIHRNTLVYRIEKIREMISIDEDDPAKRMHMLLSMDLLRNK